MKARTVAALRSRDRPAPFVGALIPVCRCPARSSAARMGSLPDSGASATALGGLWRVIELRVEAHGTGGVSATGLGSRNVGGVT